MAGNEKALSVDEAQRQRLIAGRRAHGSHSATLADQLVRREKLLKEVADATEKANMAYRKALEYERVDRTLMTEVAPGRRDGVTHVLPPLDQHPPRGDLFAPLAAATARETAARAAQQVKEADVVRKSGLTKFATAGGSVPVSTI